MALLLAIAGPTTAAPAPKRIAVTIDDLPAQWECLPLAAVQAETKALLRTLVTHHVEAIGFVNESKLYVPGEVDARIALLDDWIAAGMQLGNHGFHHIGFQHTALPVYEDNFVRGDSVTRRLLAAHGGKPNYYRYPYNQTGPTIADRDAFVAFLASRGYAPAPSPLRTMTPSTPGSTQTTSSAAIRQRRPGSATPTTQTW